MGSRSASALATLVLINLMTHPVFTFCLWVNRAFNFTNPWLLLPVLEALVALVEWRLLYYVFRGSSSRMFLISISMNAASCAGGLLRVVFARL
jgi:hypothetical protein